MPAYCRCCSHTIKVNYHSRTRRFTVLHDCLKHGYSQSNVSSLKVDVPWSEFRDRYRESFDKQVGARRHMRRLEDLRHNAYFNPSQSRVSPTPPVGAIDGTLPYLLNPQSWKQKTCCRSSKRSPRTPTQPLKHFVNTARQVCIV